MTDFWNSITNNINQQFILTLIISIIGLIILIIILRKVKIHRLNKMRMDYINELNRLRTIAEDLNDTLFDSNMFYLRMKYNLSRDNLAMHLGLPYDLITYIENPASPYANVASTDASHKYLSIDLIVAIDEYLTKIRKISQMKKFAYRMAIIRNSVVSLTEINKITHFYNITRVNLLFTDLRLPENAKMANPLFAQQKPTGQVKRPMGQPTEKPVSQPVKTPMPVKKSDLMEIKAEEEPIKKPSDKKEPVEPQISLVETPEEWWSEEKEQK